MMLHAIPATSPTVSLRARYLANRPALSQRTARNETSEKPAIWLLVIWAALMRGGSSQITSLTTKSNNSIRSGVLRILQLNGFGIALIGQHTMQHINVAK